VAIHGQDGRVLGLGTVDADGTLSPQRLFAWAVAGTATKGGNGQ
ncbi:MAG TPA: tRNA pseudouridine(55) synthase TruB, partial [Pseudoxanthomonas sp.]|nr:tRNA pseudouridine(55) synthase TruB [Pseudoxanthomonas sp.]